MISTIEYIQNGFIFCSWIAIGWILGAAFTALILKKYKG
jgi:hypothetical protein